ncbi:MAG: menaquinone reductase iron-sulfur cluster-binding subunit QrcC [Desulfonauticus sp.]|nr:menaquinone reductase iron-sulfur cluster-binding subunit QrcC [Desulfonauticus sp.]
MEHKEFKVKWGMVIDIDKCTGCGACMVACQAENNIAPMQDGSDKTMTLTWMLVYELSNGKPFPDHEIAYLPRPCMQCGKPSCSTVCPVVATTKDEEGGIVSQIYPRCIGCRYCMAACPYHARYFNWYDPKWPKGLDKTLNISASPRPRGVVEKCTFCHHRFMEAKEKARYEGKDPLKLPEDAYIPACAEICPTGAIVFGDLNNPEHKVAKLAKSKYAFRLLERLGTDPQVYYYSKREWVRRLADNYLSTEKTKGE